TQFPGPLEVSLEETSSPRFIFDAEKFPDWASPGNFQHEESESIEGREYVVSLHATQCKEGSDCGRLVKDCYAGNQCSHLEDLVADGCFINALYFKRTTDAEAAVAYRVGQLHDFGNTPKEVKVNTLTMN